MNVIAIAVVIIAVATSSTPVYSCGPLPTVMYVGGAQASFTDQLVDAGDRFAISCDTGRSELLEVTDAMEIETEGALVRVEGRTRAEVEAQLKNIKKILHTPNGIVIAPRKPREDRIKRIEAPQ